MTKLATLALLMLLSCQTKSYAQNSPSDKSPVDKSKVILTLLSRIDADEQLIKSLDERAAALDDEIAKADQARTELTEAHKQALLELGEVRATIKFKTDEIDQLKAQVDLWKNEADRTKKELKSSRKRELILMIALIARSLL